MSKKSYSGDTHNFGLSVQFEGDWVKKPRTVFWEWLFLSKDSPIRSTSNNCANKNNLHDPFTFYPNLSFKFKPNEYFHSSGRVSFFENRLSNFSKQENVDLSFGFGNCLANSFIWGLSDLHIENIGMGFCPVDFSLSVFPLDIEIVFANLNLISETYLLKSLHFNNNNSGSFALAGIKIDICEVLEGFLSAINFYLVAGQDLINALDKLDIYSIPIRVLAKPTSSYVNFLSGNETKTSFYPEEKEQLERGDIPYFYTYIGSEKAFYISEEGERLCTSNLYKENDSLTPKAFELNAIDVKIETMTLYSHYLQIARTFDPGIDQTFKSKNFKLVYQGDFIYLTYENNRKVKCRRLA